MDGRRALAWCRSQPGVAEELPFGPGTLVFKVGGRMFALFPDQPSPESVSLKCDPRFAEVLRERHPGVVVPGYHLNKRHWNTVRLDRDLPSPVVADLLEHSYTLVVDGLPRRLREELRAATTRSATE